MNKDLEKPIHVIISSKGFGKTYYEFKKIIKENERLKENAIHNDKVVDKAKWNEMLYKSRNKKAIEYLEKYDVFKEFTFPLMKRDEENQVKSSIDYQFKKDLKKNLLNILQGVGDDE